MRFAIVAAVAALCQGTAALCTTVMDEDPSHWPLNKCTVDAVIGAQRGALIQISGRAAALTMPSIDQMSEAASHATNFQTTQE